MIKLLSAFSPPEAVEISATETTASLEAKLMHATGESLEIQIQETQTGRFLPRDEVLLDEREYYVNYIRLPIKGGL